MSQVIDLRKKNLHKKRIPKEPNKRREAINNRDFSKKKSKRQESFDDFFNNWNNPHEEIVEEGFNISKRKLVIVTFACVIVISLGFLGFSFIGKFAKGGEDTKVPEDPVSKKYEYDDKEEEKKEEVVVVTPNEEELAKAWEEEMSDEIEVIKDNEGNEVLKGGSDDPVDDTYIDDRQYTEPLNPNDVSPISGIPCENKDRRPIAVMLSADKAVRPLSGIGEADIVFEMQVISGTITRLMPVFVCNSPKEIGSIRSSRHDYITLAKGLDAIYAHWGGSHFALDYLKNKKTVPDLDAMRNPYGAFFRKPGIRMPHNGFASYDGLWQASKKMGFRMENKFEGYPHRPESPLNERGEEGKLYVGLPGICNVSYEYDKKTNSYLRFWNGVEDIDKLTKKRLAPKNVVVVFAKSRQIEGQYNDVDIEGEGEMYAFMEGRQFKGSWVKEKGDCVIGDERVCVNDKRMKFFKENGEELEFVPGQIWIEVLDPGQKLEWSN